MKKLESKSLTETGKEILKLKKKGLTDLAISRKLNISETVVYEVCQKYKSKWESKTLNINLADQGRFVSPLEWVMLKVPPIVK